MQDINHGKYINYLISQSNSEIDAATSTGAEEKRGERGTDRERERESRSKICAPCGPTGNAMMVGEEKKGEGKTRAG